MRERLAPWIALSALLVLAVLTVLLAASLPRVPFSDGVAFEEREPASRERMSGASYTGPLRWPDYLLAYGPLVVLLVGLVVYLAVRGSRWSGERKSLLSWRMLLSIALVMVALALIARNQVLENLEESLGKDEPAVAQAASRDDAASIESAPIAAPPSPPSEGRVTSTMLQVVLGIAALAAAVSLLVAARRWHVRSRRAAAPPPDLDLGGVVETALQELGWGRDPVGVVERCYRDMLRAYAEACGIDPATLTPREFARSAARAGHGGEAMEELTDLFELVHYGRRPDGDFSQRAARCMVQLRESLPPVAQAGA